MVSIIALLRGTMIWLPVLTHHTLYLLQLVYLHDNMQVAIYSAISNNHQY
jgi:hypothetical protein